MNYLINMPLLLPQLPQLSGEGNSFGPEMEKLSSNISALNNTYELQLKSSNEYLASMSNMQELQESIKSVMNDLAASAGDTQAYREKHGDIISKSI